MMSARAQSKQQLYNQASRVILKLVVDPRNVTQNLEVKSKKVKKKYVTSKSNSPKMYFVTSRFQNKLLK